MAVIDEALRGSTQLSLESAEYLGLYFWNWYADHSEDKVANIRFLFINVAIKVYHVKPLFVLLFGPAPAYEVGPTP